MKLIDGVEVKELKPISDERGFLMEILRSDESIYQKFGQAYITMVKPRVVKGWHYHKKQVDHFVGIQGTSKVVLYDARQNSPTFGQVNEFLLGFEQPRLVKIPTFVYHGFTSLGSQNAMILNIPSEVYHYQNPDEYRADPFTPEIPYDWGDVDRTISR